MNADSDENDNMKRAKEAIEKYFYQLTEGCGRLNCSNINCASNPNFKKLTNNQAAALAIQLAKDKVELCESSSKSAKQFKSSISSPESSSSSSSSATRNNNSAIVATATSLATNLNTTTTSSSSSNQNNDSNSKPFNSDSTTSKPNSATASNNNNSNGKNHQDTINVDHHNNDDHDDDDDDEDEDINEDNNNLVLPNTSSNSNSYPRSLSASSSKSSDLKSLDDALKDAVKFVTQIKENADINKNSVYLSENKIQKLIKKCKEKQREANETNKETQMEVDNQEDRTNTNQNIISFYKPLINRVQQVFQSCKSLSQSFTFNKEKSLDQSEEVAAAATTEAATSSKIETSLTMPSIPPFNIDFSSLRRSYILLFGLPNESLIDELENAIDHAVYALCISIKMSLKKSDITEQEINQILHSLLVVNELPILEDPKYMDRCAKIFYATLSELLVSACAKIVRLWSKWHTDELKIFLNKLQQYITVCAISKNLDEESNRNNEDEEDANDNEQNCLHKNEGIAGAVGCLRLVYYASIIGGRLDPPEQIKKEREIETEEIKYLETSLNSEENNLINDTYNSFSVRVDPLEVLLDIRPIDCREPKIPFDQFINEVVNKFIDIQHDYVEYIQEMQNLDNFHHQQQHQHHSHQNSTNKKHIFSFLAHPFFLVLAKKNLGLYYDNKIKMMRERRNNIMMSLLEGSMPMPYFKIRLQRNNLLFDALSLIELQEQENSAILRKQLFIEFENEQGIDQGGISKEFFQLAIDELLNKGYTFFTFDDKTNYYWFTPCTLETEKEFRLIGILFGIAIYNNVLLDVQFPPVFFRKLMGKLGTFEDLFYSHPQLYQSFKSMLDFDASDEEFEETFMLTFQISLTDTFGSVVNFNLKENGDKIAVTKQNREEFVDLYADFILNKGVEDSFKAFKRGFVKITYSSPLSKWYSPEELEILLCGSKVMDWKSLETSTLYDSGFEAHHTYIQQFWDLFDEFTVDQKRLFLKFTTGTDRCPHGGLSELKLTIARNGPDTEKLPTAHTCFNVLLLPEYSSKQKLKEKLLKAIQYSRGFGLS